MLDRLFPKKKWKEGVEQPAAQLRCVTLDVLVVLRMDRNKRRGDNPASVRWACRSLSLSGPAHLPISLITFAYFSVEKFTLPP